MAWKLFAVPSRSGPRSGDVTRALAGAGALGVAFALAACAAGTEGEGDDDVLVAATGARDGGSSREDGAAPARVSRGPSRGPDGLDRPDSGVAAPVEDSGASEGDSGTPEPPGPTTTCRQPRDLGAIAGDDGTASVTAQGRCGEWLRIRVTESYTGIVAGPMRLTATLVSGGSDDFDLVAYMNKDTDLLECTTATDQSELPAGRSDVVKLLWGEEYTANSGDDSRTISLQVKGVGTDCGTQPWTLLLQGNY